MCVEYVKSLFTTRTRDRQIIHKELSCFLDLVKYQHCRQLGHSCTDINLINPHTQSNQWDPFIAFNLELSAVLAYDRKNLPKTCLFRLLLLPQQVASETLSLHFKVSKKIEEYLQIHPEIPLVWLTIPVPTRCSHKFYFNTFSTPWPNGCENALKHINSQHKHRSSDLRFTNRKWTKKTFKILGLSWIGRPGCLWCLFLT